jgi:hypothetical protein
MYTHGIYISTFIGVTHAQNACMKKIERFSLAEGGRFHRTETTPCLLRTALGSSS